VPAAVSLVLDTNVVLSVVEPILTTAPLTKLLPFNVMVKFPASIWGGAAEESCGTGLSNVVTVEAVRPLWFGTAAAIVTAFGDGSVAGAVYVAVKGPVLVIVPTIAFPFAMSFTVQVTVGFVSFATVAVKACVPLARTEGPEGETATRSVPVDELPVRPAQLAVTPAMTQTESVSPKRRTAASPVLIRKILAETLSTPSPLESFGNSERAYQSFVQGGMAG
jgi:hypothetical protein